MPLRLRSSSDDASLIDLLDRILDKGIILDPFNRLAMAGYDLRASNSRVVVAPERRRRPFVVPKAQARPR